jgi:hypothetical protein
VYLFERIFALRALIAAAMAGNVWRGERARRVARWSWVELGAAIFGVEMSVDPFLARRISPADDRFSECHVRMSA